MGSYQYQRWPRQMVDHPGRDRPAGGWHCAIDDLETHLTGTAFEHSFEDRARFYADYLTDHFRLLAYVSSDTRRE